MPQVSAHGCGVATPTSGGADNALMEREWGETKAVAPRSNIRGSFCTAPRRADERRGVIHG